MPEPYVFRAIDAEAICIRCRFAKPYFPGGVTMCVQHEEPVEYDRPACFEFRVRPNLAEGFRERAGRVLDV